MRSFSSKSWAKTMKLGLRKHPETNREIPELVELHCLRPTENGLGLHVAINSMNSGTWSRDQYSFLYDVDAILIEDSTGEDIEVL